MTQKRRLAVLGCTGSVGENALRLVADRRDRFDVCALAAHRSTDALATHAASFSPAGACLADADAPLPTLPAGAALFRGADGILEMLDATRPDIVLNAITGAAGLPASEWALRNGRTLALANKESIVMAGPYLLELAREHGGTILPVDSEHCAIFQCLQGEQRRSVRRIWLTGSGGPFRERDLDTFDAITPAEALRHPTWDMGPRITIGSATMMNKAFEIVEARWLFDLEPEQIRVVIHPQSIVHSMVEFVDGSIIAQLGVPDMRVPILYCLGYPDRLEFDFEPFDPVRFRNLEFVEVEDARYPAISLAGEVLSRGGDSGAVLNAADEVMTQEFLEGRVGFPAIVATVRDVLRSRDAQPLGGLADVLAADRAARAATTDRLAARAD